MLDLESSKHGHKFVELSEFSLELWEMWTGMSGTREFVFVVIFSKHAVFLFLGFWVVLKTTYENHLVLEIFKPR